jgi:CRISPR-associated protein Cmr4
MQAHLFFVHALSPLHAGTGQGIDVIDLPIAREKATGIPFLPGSSLKGTLRDLCTDIRYAQVFGPDTNNAAEYAGAVQFSDQRLLLLPIRSLAGTFAWVTSPYLLRRFVRDADSAGVTGLPAIPQPGSESQCLIVDSACRISLARASNQQVFLEDLDLQAAPQTLATAWATQIGQRLFPHESEWQQMLHARFCIVHDDVLSFLLNTALEITARIKLKEATKTVEKGGLWYEESLPTETVLSGLMLITPNKSTGLADNEIFTIIESIIKQNEKARPVQLGGKATVGRGLCQVKMV